MAINKVCLKCILKNKCTLFKLKYKCYQYRNIH